MSYEDLLNEADQSGLTVKEASLQSNDGRIKGKRIAIRRDIPTVKKADVLAEELGHYRTTAGDILDQSSANNRKQERTARLWAYNKRIGLSGIIQGFRQHCHSRYELAECLGVSEEFLQEAIECYREKYGCMVELDGYIILFEPSLAVMEKL
ncbi:ImmA/IrrE family metallo-endopeptidase [Lacrimispora sp. 210928-DFI.3.58]|uniref:ImmA/IrrE family metallo-endopeptidase n=1 Tax=Lacrimispora sp. 210928-DFI.3.58 TaxID=2883214 RepID=UPI001D06A430|nr:ImmA/IrrE family metallo-endopeptidase [Lacrimispora sp. 210928-DFI.3.58]MCB7320147.1 ImmA/IrrE family metallo-endopeptidase [Lacrimispora sp. 210928-DFI.3.58]